MVLFNIAGNDSLPLIKLFYIYWFLGLLAFSQIQTQVCYCSLTSQHSILSEFLAKLMITTNYTLFVRLSHEIKPFGIDTLGSS